MTDWAAILPMTIAALQAGRSISLEAPSGQPVVLSDQDIPTLERALQAARGNQVAWLGFKLVDNPQACMGPGDERFPTGSACDRSFVFFADAQGQLTCGHPFNDRDRFQMLDITRGPSMHAGQFAGLTWESIPLKRHVRVGRLRCGGDIAPSGRFRACRGVRHAGSGRRPGLPERGALPPFRLAAGGFRGA